MMATQLVERREDPVAVVRQTLNTMGDQLKMALPAHVSVDKFNRVTMTALQANPALLNADRRSLFGAIVKAAQDGLLPDGREGALVQFGQQVTWMPMIGGILKKVRNSGELSSIDALLVHANDRFAYRPGLDDVPTHEPDWFGDRGEVIGAYAVARLKSGAAFVEIMNRQQIEQVRNVSRSKGNGPWVAWWGEMARKTVLRRLAKRLPMSTDIEAEFERDETMAADVAAAAIAAPAPVSRLDALEQRILPPIDDDGDDDAQDEVAEDPEIIPPAAMEEAAVDDVSPHAGADDGGALDGGFDLGEPDHVEAARGIEAALKAAEYPSDLEAVRRMKAEWAKVKRGDPGLFDTMVRIAKQVETKLAEGADA